MKVQHHNHREGYNDEPIKPPGFRNFEMHKMLSSPY
jgi:hypothetical protein